MPEREGSKERAVREAADREGDQETMSESGRAQLGAGAAPAASCPKCGKRPDEWSAPVGYEKDGERYCCEGCAEDIGCVCHEAEAARRPPRAATAPTRRAVGPGRRGRKSAASTPARRPPDRYVQDTVGDEGGVGQTRGSGAEELE